MVNTFLSSADDGAGSSRSADRLSPRLTIDRTATRSIIIRPMLNCPSNTGNGALKCLAMHGCQKRRVNFGGRVRPIKRLVDVRALFFGCESRSRFISDNNGREVSRRAIKWRNACRGVMANWRRAIGVVNPTKIHCRLLIANRDVIAEMWKNSIHIDRFSWLFSPGANVCNLNATIVAISRVRIRSESDNDKYTRSEITVFIFWRRWEGIVFSLSVFQSVARFDSWRPIKSR